MTMTRGKLPRNEISESPDRECVIQEGQCPFLHKRTCWKFLGIHVICICYDTPDSFPIYSLSHGLFWPWNGSQCSTKNVDKRERNKWITRTYRLSFSPPSYICLTLCLLRTLHFQNPHTQPTTNCTFLHEIFMIMFQHLLILHAYYCFTCRVVFVFFFWKIGETFGGSEESGSEIW